MRFGRRTQGARRGRNSPPQRTSRPPQPPSGYHSVQQTHYEPYYESPGASSEKKKGRSCSPLLIWLAVLSYVAVLVLGVFPIIGCMTSKAGVDSLYLVQLRQNTSQDLQFGLGYFGGCVSTSTERQTGSRNTSSSTSTHCITNLRTKDVDDIAELYTENLPNRFQSQLTPFLNTALPLAKDLQSTVFYWQLPVLHYAFLILSSLILWVALMSSSQKRRYKFILFLGGVLSAFTLALALIMGIGSLQAMNALDLLAGSGSGSTSNTNSNSNPNSDSEVILTLGDGITLHEAHRLANVQYAQAGVVGLFYILLGIMFVRRKAEDSGLTVLAFVPAWPRFGR
ncbi:hypothetical protein BJX70DRAFT_344315 [Aspergillus crustosus]